MAEETRRIDLTGAGGGQPLEQVVASDALAGGEQNPLDQPLAYVSLGLTVGDGFKFGCGFTLALAIATLLLVVIASLVFLAASILGLPIPSGTGTPTP